MQDGGNSSVFSCHGHERSTSEKCQQQSWNLLKKQWIFFVGLITGIAIVLSSKKLIGTTRTLHTQLLIRLTLMSAPTTLALHYTSFHKMKWTASNRIYREDKIVTLIVIMILHLKKMTIDLSVNVTVPGPTRLRLT